jgi:hypothetical protein
MKGSPLMRLAVVVGCILSGVAFGARAEGLICTMISPLSGKPFIVEYRREGDFLVETNFGLKYRVLQDNAEGLIATWALAKHGERPSSVAANVILLNKATKQFKLSIVDLDGAGTTSAGSCL